MGIRSIEIQHFKGLREVHLEDCGSVNAIIGKNNSGKSSVLHALDIAGLALTGNAWDRFQYKLEMKDLFADVGDFALQLVYESGTELRITATTQFGPQFTPPPTDDQKFRSILVSPDIGTGLLGRNRQHRTPKMVMDHVENRNFDEINALDILHAIRYYGERSQRQLTEKSYAELVEQIRRYFPDIEEVESSRTELDISTLTYKEYGKRFDILYSGTGLKHFLDVLLKTTLSGAQVVLLDEPELGLHPDLQRRFVEYLAQLAKDKGIQFFLATHSPVLLNYADAVTYHRITNTKGKRTVSHVQGDAVDTLLADLGLRPSDILNQDMCVVVEGASDVVFMEHVLHVLYRDEFRGLAVAVVQYAGGAADGIISGTIDVGNIVPAQPFTFWIRDRDSSPDGPPSSESTKFVRALEGKGAKGYIWKKREIEFYYPEAVHVAAQQGDRAKENSVRGILNGAQTEKFTNAAKRENVNVPRGKNLRRLLREHLNDRSELDPEIQTVVGERLIPWRNKLLGIV